MRLNILFCLIIYSALFAFTHPRDLTYPELEWSIPNGDDLLMSLPSEEPLLYKKDSLSGIFSLRVVLRRGTLQSPLLASIYTQALREGGGAKFRANAVDSLLDQYAINLSISANLHHTTITLEGLNRNWDIAIELLSDLLHNPAFEAERIKRIQSSSAQILSHQFSTAEPLLSAAWQKLIYPETALSLVLKPEHIQSLSIRQITRALKTFHKKMLEETPILAAYSGDLSSDLVSETIGKIFTREAPQLLESEPILANRMPQYLIVHKPVNQAYIRVGQAGVKRPDENYYGAMVFNEILGGGGFSSRLVTEVRSNAGLTYSIHSHLESNYFHEGTFSTTLFTSSERVNQALFLTIETIRETLNEELTDEEIDHIVRRLTESLPSHFRTPREMVFAFLTNSINNRSSDHFQRYPDALKSLSSEDISNSARAIIDPDKLSIVIVGDTTELKKAPSFNGYNLNDIGFKIITESDMFFQGKIELKP